METLPNWLAWAVGGGAGVAVWALVEILKKRPKFQAVWNRMQPETRRLSVFAVASVAGGLLFWGQVALGYVPSPGSTGGWLEALFAIVVSQVVHAGVKLAKK